MPIELRNAPTFLFNQNQKLLFNKNAIFHLQLLHLLKAFARNEERTPCVLNKRIRAHAFREK